MSEINQERQSGVFIAITVHCDQRPPGGSMPSS